MLLADSAFAQGKIAGRVTDAGSGMGLPGVNVALDGTTQGTVTDPDGYYTIINVRPGTYVVRASFVGYTPGLVENVRVSTGLTTDVDFALQEEVVEGQELIVTAERPIVQLDVSANVASINPEEYQDMPVAGVSEVIDLQAGIEPGLQIRGGGLNEIAFVVDGMNMRTGRNQDPFTNISYTSVEEVQVQTGGFNAEYGNVRAGVVNVTTKDPSRTRYSFDGFFRLTPAQDRSLNALGQLPENLADCGYGTNDVDPSCDTPWTRPLFDPEVALDGTGNWDAYTQRQYLSFEGWNSVANRLRNDEGFDVTAQDLIEHAQYQRRKDNTIDDPSYEADITFGGPLIPTLSNQLGGLRFQASYRGTQTPYLIPQTRDVFRSHTYQGKLVANPGPGMRLSVNGMLSTERGQNDNCCSSQVGSYSGWISRYPWGWNPDIVSRNSIRGDDVYSDGNYNLADVDHNMIGASFTHTINASTFYEINVQNVSSKYRSGFPNLRDATFICPASGIGPDGDACSPNEVKGVLFTDNFGRVLPEYRDRIGQDRDGDGHIDVTCFGGDSDLNGDGEVQPYCVGEEPFGFAGIGGNLIGSISTGGHWSKVRDTTDTSVFSGSFDVTSQVNRFWQLQTGAELIFSDLDVRFLRNNVALGSVETRSRWQRSPIQGAVYGQSKLEFQGMIANVGLRLDYFDANSEWWVFEGPYDQAFRALEDELDEILEKQSPDAQLYLSPRIGVSFPITFDSKLYFNYGHFRQQLQPFDIFGVESNPAGGINIIGNPDHPMPKTVAYELGFDQNLFDQYLLRVSGFYRDIRDQPRPVTFESLGGIVNYQTRRPWNYEDVRGFEVQLQKMGGRFFRGFLNYTFLQTKNGNFGYANFYENSFDMRNYLRTSTDYRLSAPLATPFARLNLIFLTPPDWGVITGDWRVSLLGEWRQGEKFIWDGGGSNFPELQENVSWRDYRNWDLRFTKHFTSSFGDLQLFMDIDNLFNQKHLYVNAAFAEAQMGRDRDNYFWSLHLPEDTFDQLNTVNGDQAFGEKVAGGGLPYTYIPGNDKPGDFRKPDVAFQPMEAVTSLDGVDNPNTVAWYWAADTGTYSRWTGSAWEVVPQGEVDQALDDKAYIDMPNLRYKTFLNSRRLTLGLRITL